MTQYLVTKDKLDALAVSVSDKSGETLPLTIDGMREAVNGIDLEPNLQAKTRAISAAGTFVDTPDTGYDGLSSVTTTVPKGEMAATAQSGYTIVNGAMKWRYRGEALIAVEDGDGTPGFIENDTIVYGTWQTHNAISAGTSVTPTESAQTIGGSNTMMGGAVTVNAIPSNYVGSGITQRSSTDLSASGNTVSVPSGYYASSASKAVASGTEGTPTATKGSVSNHAISVTPSVTNSAGYISGGTKTGTAVSVSASELVSGNKEITENGTNIDVTNYATVSVDVAGGGGGGGGGIATDLNDSHTDTVAMFSMQSEPSSFAMFCLDSSISPSATARVASIVYDGTTKHEQVITNVTNSQVNYSSSDAYYNFTGSTLEIITNQANLAGAYGLVYSYGSGVSVDTKNVQVGSGATSITFTGLEDEPLYWVCAFKSSFGTSSGYQRVIYVVYDGTSVLGMEMDSAAKASSTHWSASYSNGTLTITSQGTNAGGYFHQPGNYQLTYAYGGEPSPYQAKTVTPTTSQQIVEPDTGYEALSQVTVNAIPSTYVQPTSTVGATTYRPSTTQQTIASGTYHSAAATIAAVSQTNLSAENIKSGTTISISNGQSNLWSITGTYTGGGSASIDTKTVTSSNRPTSLSFTSMLGQPKAFFLRCTSSMSRSSNSTYYYVATMRYNGTNTTGNCWRMSNGNWTNITSGYSYTYSGTTLTVSSSGSTTASPGCFYPGNYELVYVY